MFQNVIAFLGGVVLLGLGAGWLVRGASTVAQSLGIPRHVVGLTLVALGTSAPELFVNLIAASRGETDFALSNVSGSNLANVCLGFGLCAMVGSVHIRRKDFATDTILLVVAPLTVLVMFYSQADYGLPLLATVPLTCLLVYYLHSLRGRQSIDEEAATSGVSVWQGLLLFFMGVISLYFGGNLVLEAAIDVARTLQIDEGIIGLTIVAVGTSVPDITASVVAIRHGEHGIAVGNILGSNVSNLVLVLNGTIIVSRQSLPTDAAIRGDYFVVCATSLFCCLFAWRREAVSRPAGIILLFTYFAYIGYRVVSVWQGVS